MAHEIFVAPLWEQVQSTRFADLPNRLREAALSVVPAEDEKWQVGEIEQGKFEIDMPDGTARIEAEHVAFRLQRFSSDVARLVHAIAKAADLAIVNEGGGPHILLVDSRHLQLLSPDLLNENPVVCRTAAELDALLAPYSAASIDEQRDALGRRDELYSRWTRDHQIRSIGSGDPEPNLPGLAGSRQLRPVYVEVKTKEGPLLLFRRFSRFIDGEHKKQRAIPDGGSVGNSSWQIRLPTGRVFNCWTIAGRNSLVDTDGGPGERRSQQWLAIVREFAASSDRSIAMIVDGDRVVLDDGSSYPISDCESRRANDD